MPAPPRPAALTWKVYYPGQVIAPLTSKIDHIVIVVKGSVLMTFPVTEGPNGRAQEHTVVASVGESQRSWRRLAFTLFSSEQNDS
jgi:hypothetical protein